MTPASGREICVAIERRRGGKNEQKFASRIRACGTFERSCRPLPVPNLDPHTSPVQPASVRVIERFICARTGDPERCEDGIAIGAHHLAVIDGVSDKTGRALGGMSGGRRAMLALTDTIRAFPADIDMQGAVVAMSSTVGALAHMWDIDPERGDGPAAVVAIYSAHHRQVWRIGDIGVRIGPMVHPGRMYIDEITTGARAAYLRARALAGDDSAEDADGADDAGRALIMPLLRVQHRFRNLDDGDCEFAYGAIDGRPVPPRFVETFAVPPDTQVVFASDGYPHVPASLVEGELRLAEANRTDPLRIGHHRGTRAVPDGGSYDDRAWLRFAT